MKKLFLTTVCILFASFLFGQTLSKGSILSLHVLQFELKPDVTMEQYEKFIIKKYIPAFNDTYEGMTLMLVKGLRGENENSLGFLYYMESDEIRKKYWPEEGVPSELYKASQKKLQKVNKELSKLVTHTGRSYTDWIVK